MHSMRIPYSLCLATLLAMCGAGVLSATLVSYDNLAVWETATSPGYGLIDFEITTSYISYNNGTGYVTGGVQFIGITDSTPPYELTVVDGGIVGHNYGSGDVLKGPAFKTGINEESLIRVNLPGGITSFGLDLMAYDESGATAPQNYTIRVGLTDFGVTTLAQSASERLFFGLTSTDPIGSIDLILLTGGSSMKPVLDNFRYGAVEEVSHTPEPGTYLLVGSGLLAAGLYRRRSHSVGS